MLTFSFSTFPYYFHTCLIFSLSLFIFPFNICFKYYSFFFNFDYFLLYFLLFFSTVEFLKFHYLKLLILIQIDSFIFIFYLKRSLQKKQTASWLNHFNLSYLYQHLTLKSFATTLFSKLILKAKMEIRD